jgi:hypothetical protein
MQHKKILAFTIRATFVFTLLLAVGVLGAENKINKSDLPSAVQKTADEQSQGATVKGYSKEIENGKVEYEVELMVNDHSKDVTMDAQGNVVEVEEEVSLDSLPAAVRRGLQQRAGQGTIRKVESLAKHGALVAYEAQVLTAGKRSEIQVGPDGKPLDHKE